MAEQGRPKVLDEKMRETLCGLVHMGFNRWQAAQHMGISRTTLYRAARADPEFRRQIRNAELHQELRPLQRIVEHMPKSWRAAAWVLERQKPDLYVRRSPNTVTLADLHGIFGAMMKLLLEGVPEQENRDRVMKNFEGFFERLGGHKRYSPRVRRAIMETELEQQCQGAANNSRFDSAADAASIHTGEVSSGSAADGGGVGHEGAEPSYETSNVPKGE